MDPPRKQHTVLVATDDSEHSKYALQWTLDTLLLPGNPNSEPGDPGDTLILLHVKPTPVSYVGPGYVMAPDVLISIDKARDREIAAFMSEASKKCEERNVSFATKVVVGDARDAICEATEKLKVDYLVMGSHGYGAVKRVVLGSVSDYCVHHAKCPVVIVKKPRKAKDAIAVSQEGAEPAPSK